MGSLSLLSIHYSNHTLKASNLTFNTKFSDLRDLILINKCPCRVSSSNKIQSHIVHSRNAHNIILVIHALRDQ